MQLCAEDGTVLKWMIYSIGTSTDPADWFSSDTFHSSSWTDLRSSWSGEYWSILGEYVTFLHMQPRSKILTCVDKNSAEIIETVIVELHVYMKLGKLKPISLCPHTHTSS